MKVYVLIDSKYILIENIVRGVFKTRELAEKVRETYGEKWQEMMIITEHEVAE